MRIIETKRMYSDMMRRCAIDEEWFDLADSTIYEEWFDLTRGEDINNTWLYLSAKMVYNYTDKYRNETDYGKNEIIAHIMYILNRDCVTTTYEIIEE